MNIIINFSRISQENKNIIARFRNSFMTLINICHKQVSFLCNPHKKAIPEDSPSYGFFVRHFLSYKTITFRPIKSVKYVIIFNNYTMIIRFLQ